MRVLLNAVELRAMAFMRSSLVTSSWMRDWRAGVSKALIVPSRNASAMTCHSCTMPIKVSVAKSAAWRSEAVWVKSTTFWRSKRSAATPPRSVKSKTGRNCEKLTTPKLSADFVKR
jgi:hypothetical protein